MRAAFSALALGACLTAPPGVYAAPALPLTACVIEHPLRLSVLAADCGVLEVPENPAAPQGRQIGLHVARIPAVSRRKLADPLFVLAGGPGQAAGAFYATVAGAFERVHRERDIVLIDQRGTGSSNALECAEDEDGLYRASEAEVAAATRRCLAALGARAEVAYYTTSVAVTDLERVRAALGYERLNLYGVSYGTRVAQHYLRRYPARVRAVILDGVVPPQLVIGPAIALDAESALRRILARCAAEAQCRARFGNPQDDYQALRVTLRQRTIPVALPDPSTGERQHLEFNLDHLASVLRLGGYSADYAALLPLLLHDAAARADYTPLAAQFLLLQRAYEGLAVGMHNSVLCAEDVPRYDTLTIDRAALAQTFIGTAAVDTLTTICRLWPRGPVDADFHAPLQSVVPALLLSGSEDPVTPPQYASQAAAGFAHAREVVLAGFGHGQLTAPCVGRLLAQFLAHASVETLDLRCTSLARPMPFFTSLNGPPP
jgi:pimeloyl-ACP methyl ester carboxylesterase